jgi:hypothetical protein
MRTRLLTLTATAFTGVCKLRILHVGPEVVLSSAQANVKLPKLCDTAHKWPRLKRVPQPYTLVGVLFCLYLLRPRMQQIYTVARWIATAILGVVARASRRTY